MSTVNFEQDTYTLGVDLIETSEYSDSDVEHSKSLIDTAAEELRLLLLSPGTGQAMVYQEKEREARAIKTDTTPDAADYPLVAVDSEIDSVTLTEAADAIIARANAFRVVGGEIERMRLGAKKKMKTERDASRVIDLVAGVSEQELARRLRQKGIQLSDLM